MSFLKDFRQEVFWLIDFNSSDTWEMVLFRGLLWLLLTYGGLYVFRAVLAAVVDIGGYLDRLGVRLIASDNERQAVRRRKQLCLMLKNDLLSLAKGENWNDQAFTDLEAELEATGEYYESKLNRLLKIRSEGLRRVESLMKGIDSSAEKLILLTGEPGSGKSVSMRHLAISVAEAAATSKAKKCLVPLYVNLRELTFEDVSQLTPDYFKEFVISNVRRGDADMAQLIKDLWSEYRDHGSWYILFDSFDEIPSIMHAPHGSKIVAECAKAIQRFVDGMGDCRGIIASREYKGPEQLTLSKFRILPLSLQFQERLVKNAFISASARKQVLDYLALESPPLANNPLFLTLICRYTKERGETPHTDYQLLIQHIEYLIQREPEYLEKKYSLTPDSLFSHARLIAYTIAHQSELGLAPTVDEISNLLQRKEYKANDVKRIITALVDVKVGRFDVPSARIGEMRFAFSHRRYQEALFVSQLSINLHADDLHGLLLKAEWRDYAVTFCQTQPAANISKLIDKTCDLLDRYASSVEPVREEPLPQVFSIASLFQEGLARRSDVEMSRFRASMDSILWPYWKRGDYYTKLKILTVCGVMSTARIASLIRFSSSCGIRRFEETAFKQCSYASSINPELGMWLRSKLSNQVLIAISRGDQARLSALAKRLPPEVGAECVLMKSRILHRCIFHLVHVLNRGAKKNREGLPVVTMAISMGLTLLFVLAAVSIFGKSVTESRTEILVSKCIGILSGLGFIFLVGLSLVRSTPEKLTPIALSKAYLGILARVRAVRMRSLVLFAQICSIFLVLFVPTIAVLISAHICSEPLHGFIWLGILLANIAFMFVLMTVDHLIDQKRVLNRCNTLSSEGNKGADILIKLKSPPELFIAVRTLGDEILKTHEETRRAISIYSRKAFKTIADREWEEGDVNLNTPASFGQFMDDLIDLYLHQKERTRLAN